MMNRKMTFDEVMQALADGRHVAMKSVKTKALDRKIWVAEWHIPGCLSESHDICLTKAQAIDAAVAFTGADGSSEVEHKIRGIRTALKRDGSFQHHTELFGTVTTTIEQRRLWDYLS